MKRALFLLLILNVLESHATTQRMPLCLGRGSVTEYPIFEGNPNNVRLGKKPHRKYLYAVGLCFYVFQYQSVGLAEFHVKRSHLCYQTQHGAALSVLPAARFIAKHFQMVREILREGLLTRI